MKMLKRSAELLNDVDSFERRMRVQLFQQENEWPYVEGEWNPCDFLYPQPKLERHFNATTGNFELVFIGNCARPMIDEFEIDPYVEFEYEPGDDSDPFYDSFVGSANYVRVTGRPTCVPCQVDWEGDDPCFVCGAPAPAGNSYLTAMKGLLFSEDTSPISWTQLDTPSDIVGWMQEKIRLQLNEMHNRVIVYGTERARGDRFDEQLLAYTTADVIATGTMFLHDEIGEMRIVYGCEPIRLTPVEQNEGVRGVSADFMMLDETSCWSISMGRRSNPEAELAVPARFWTVGRVRNLNLDDGTLLPGPVRPVFDPSEYENRGGYWDRFVTDWARNWARRRDGRP